MSMSCIRSLFFVSDSLFANTNCLVCLSVWLFVCLFLNDCGLVDFYVQGCAGHIIRREMERDCRLWLLGAGAAVEIVSGL